MDITDSRSPTHSKSRRASQASIMTKSKSHMFESPKVTSRSPNKITESDSPSKVDEKVKTAKKMADLQEKQDRFKMTLDDTVKLEKSQAMKSLELDREQREWMKLSNKKNPSGYTLIYPFIRQSEEDLINTLFQDEWSSFLYDIEIKQRLAEEEAQQENKEVKFNREEMYLKNVKDFSPDYYKLLNVPRKGDTNFKLAINSVIVN
jgi:hypothetical protein